MRCLYPTKVDVGPSFRRLMWIEDAFTVFELVALAGKFNDFALVEQPIQQSCCRNLS